MHIADKAVRSVAVTALGLLSLFLFAKTIGEFQSYRYIGSYPSSPSQISVQGKGEVVAVPDVATFSFGVTEENLVVKTAQDEAAKTMNAIIEYLKKNGVADKDIMTSGYTIYPRYEYASKSVTSSYFPVPPEGRQTLAAYVVSQTVTVKIRTLGDAGKLLSGIGEQGAANISGLSFDFDKREELVKEARDKAIAEARKEAEKLARSLGVRLVRITSYSDGGYYPYAMKSYAMEAQAMDGRGGASVPPSIPVGEDKIVSNVTIMYEVK